MTNRIRYSKTSEPGVLVSVKRFEHPSSGAKFLVKLNTNNNNFTIEDVATGVPYKTVLTGEAGSMHRVKMRAKEALVELGIDFEKESRTTQTKPVEQC